MSAENIVRQNKTALHNSLCGDYRLILTKVHEEELITDREYNNLKSINKETVEGHVIDMVDKILTKGEDTCQAFLNLLQTDDDIKATFPTLKNIFTNSRKRIQATSCILSPDIKRIREDDEQYQLNSQPTGLCVIINNENFENGSVRSGTNKDAESLAMVFSWLGFRVLMCKDQTMAQMDAALNFFASLSDLSLLHELSVKEWSNGVFTDLQEAPKHGDAFICCILSHGERSSVFGIDWKPLSIKQITRTFKGTSHSSLTGKPKVFLVQACQGNKKQHGVLLKDLQTDDSQSLFIPEEADVLVACATVEDHVSFRHKLDGSWFIQAMCQQLRNGCPRGDDMTTILHRVNDEVSQKEASSQPGRLKQMPEVRFTLRKRLVLSPQFP